MEMENKYASKGIAGTALGLGIGALGVEALRGGFNGILGGGNGCCNEDHTVNRYEAAQQARIAELETEVKLRDANTFTMGEMGKLRDYVDRRFEVITSSINSQAVYNATNTATIGCIQGQVAQLLSLTKVVVPNSSICPGWGDVTVAVTPAPTTGG
jgi:hypothetical protein